MTSPSAPLEIFLLGRVSVRLDGQAHTDFVTRKEQALLAYLAYSGRPQPRDALAEMLWTGRPAAQSQANLRTVLTNLRRHLEPYLVSEGDQVGLRPDSFWLDSDEMCRRLAAAHLPALGGAPGRAEGLRLAQALGLYQGDFLGSFGVRQAEGFEEWAAVERSELRYLALTGLRDLSAYYAARGRLAEALQATRRWLLLDPLDEAGNRALLRLLAQNDQRNAALQHYAKLARLLERELDAAPDSETQSLVADIRAGRVRAGSFAPMVLPGAPAPTFVTPFVGRAEELARLSAWLADPDVRLITLYGLGGSGKTRLAAQVLPLAGPDFYRGARFVSLAGARTMLRFWQALAAAVGLQPQARRPLVEQVTSYLRDRELLVVLDNAEQLLALEDGSFAEALAQLLLACPQVVWLVTSRTRLNLRGERALLLEGLPLPPHDDDPAAAGYASVALYLVNSGYALADPDRPPLDLPGVVRLCRVCAGLPLAIELAAVQAAWKRPAALADEISADLRGLDAAGPDLPAAHRSLHAVFETSWRQLTPSEQTILARLTVFQDGFTPEAAAAVTGATAAGLAALAHKTRLRLAASGRYEMHPLVHQHAANKLAERADDTAAAQHSAYYLSRLAAHQPALFGPQSFAQVAELRSELPNLRRAWRWAAAHGQTAALAGALDALDRFLALSGQPRDAYDLALAGAEAAPEAPTAWGERALRSLCLTVAAQAHLSFGSLEESLRLAHAALATAEQAGSIEACLRAQLALAEVHREAGRTTLTREHALAALALAEAAFEPYWQLLALRLLRGEETGTTLYLERALQLAQDLGDHWLETLTMVTLGGSHMHAGRYGLALAAWRQALDRAETLGNVRLVAACRNNVADAHQQLGDYAAAQVAYDAALALARDQGDRRLECGILEGASRTALLLGQTERARTVALAALKFSAGVEHPFAQIFLHGILGHAARRLGRPDEAARHYQAGLALATAERLLEIADESQAGLAALALERGDVSTALHAVESVLAHWLLAPPDGYPNPRPVVEICLAVLRAAADPRAEALARAARTWPHARAAEAGERGGP